MFVETKREGKAPVKEKPSLEGFVAWLEQQPANEEYDLWDPDNCALGQYFKSVGRFPKCGIWQAEREMGIAEGRAYRIVSGPSHIQTFGKALHRARNPENGLT